MPIQLDHVIVPAQDPIAGAKLLADLLDVPWENRTDPFTPVHVNENLTFDFAPRKNFEGRHHFCFRVEEKDFDAILGRVRAAGMAYRSHPMGDNDMKINTRLGGKNIYWEDADKHLWEILTVSYARG